MCRLNGTSLDSIRSVALILVVRLIRLRFPQVKPLSTQELAAWLAQKEALKPLLLDVRTPEEYQISHLQHAQLAPADLQELSIIATPEIPIVTYCSIGYRSAKLAQKLQQAGYRQVFNLEGSIFRWMNEERLVYQNDRVVQQVHPYNRFWQWFLRSNLVKE